MQLKILDYQYQRTVIILLMIFTMKYKRERLNSKIANVFKLPSMGTEITVHISISVEFASKML